MTMMFSLAVAVLFAAGCYLLLKPDFVKILGGIILISNAAILFIMAAGLSRGREAIYPIEPGQRVSDPLVQSMALTAIVISFGVSALMIGMIYRVYMAHRSIDVELISDIEEREVQIEEEERLDQSIEAMPDREETVVDPAAEREPQAVAT
ncbi:MAG: NADH-quinone oxidoreductase subunit K [Thermomicrobiales bacterium]|jgi:multicomponent Na+:H+ antiporter subunit C|nr:NADH-quinone oxidoreductase subunit K [Thermomicrobiales bacterium]